MATTEMRPVCDPGATQAGGEAFADRVLSVMAMTGAVVGGVAGTALGAEAGTAFPVACGTLGTMLGSGLAASGWWVFAQLWVTLRTFSEVRRARPRTGRGASALQPVMAEIGTDKSQD